MDESSLLQYLTPGDTLYNRKGKSNHTKGEIQSKTTKTIMKMLRSIFYPNKADTDRPTPQEFFRRHRNCNNHIVRCHDRVGPFDIAVGEFVRIQQFETLSALVIVFIYLARF